MNRIYLQPLLTVAGLALVAAVVALVIVAQPLLAALLVAALLGYLLDPLVYWCRGRWQLSREGAARIVFVGTLLLLVGLLSLLGSFAITRWPNWSNELQLAWQEVRNWASQPRSFLGYQVDGKVALAELERSVANAWQTLPSNSLNVLSSLSSNLLWSAVTLVSLYYFLADGPKIKPTLISLFPERFQLEATYLLDETDKVWGVFLRMQLLIFAILAILVLVSTSLILLLFRAGWLPLSPVGVMILLVLMYAGIQQIDNFWLRPQWLGGTLQLHPGIVFVGLISAVVLSGVLGALLIVPVLATIKLIATYFHAKLLGRDLHLPEAYRPHILLPTAADMPLPDENETN